MRKMILMALVLLGWSVGQAGTINATNGDLYQGNEMVNERATGNTCYLYVDYIETNPVGLHCYNLTTRPVFTTDRATQPNEIVVMGHITNFHRPEYPKVKTCAMSLDGKTSGNDIYGADDTIIYNQLFSWEGKLNGNQFDFFVTFSPDTKKPSRTRLHRMSWLSETDYDCVNLQKL